jgi:hypothetical protein
MNKKQWLKTQKNRIIIGQHTCKPKMEILKGIAFAYDINYAAVDFSTLYEIHIIMFFCIKIGWAKLTYYDDVMPEINENYYEDVNY